MKQASGYNSTRKSVPRKTTYQASETTTKFGHCDTVATTLVRNSVKSIDSVRSGFSVDLR